MAERFIQKDGQEVYWPVLPSAEDLNPLRDRAYKALYLFEIRRIRNMPPPTIRQVGKYVGTNSSSSAKYVVGELIRDGYLTKYNDEGKISDRNIMIGVNFLTVRRLTTDLIEMPEVPGLTLPKATTEKDQH